MDRRKFLKGSAIGAAAAATGAAASFPMPAITQERMEWRMVTSWPKGLPGVGTGAEKLAKRITDMSGGRLTVTLYAAGELVPALEVWSAVSEGTAEMGHDAAYYHLGKAKVNGFFTAFPFGLTGAELNAWLLHGGGQELWDEHYARFNLKGFQAGNTGTQMFGWFRKEMTSVADFNGLKFRTPGLGGEVVKKLGATVVLLPGGEIFQALQSGTIDAAEWIGPYNDLSLGLFKAASYYYYPGYQEPGAGLQLTVNKAKYDALPNDLKEIVRAAAQAANEDMRAEYDMRSGQALRTLVTEHGVQLRQLPRDVLVAVGNAANEVLNETYEQGDDVSRRIIESYLAARSDLIRYTRITEQAYTNARTLDFPHALKK